MSSIDQRIVSMEFQNQLFERGVAQTLLTLTKLDTTLKNLGSASGFANIEAQANKVTLTQPMSALDKLKVKLGLAGSGAEHFQDIENAASKVTLGEPLSALDKLKAKLFRTGEGAAEGFGNIDRAANKVELTGPLTALDKIKARLFGVGDGAAQGFSEIDRAGNRVTLEGPARAADKVQSKLDHLSAGTTFTDIENASNRVELRGLSRAIDGVSSQFSILEGAASVALGNIASKATFAGTRFVKGFAFGPITQGFDEYKLNLQSIQTILANTDFAGTNLKDVKGALAELNTYSDQTIYNFAEMAKNIGTFTAAGVDLDTSVSAIKGISNLAALSGANSEQAARAAYQLSQAISAGKVGLQDYNSVVNAGIGGRAFQKTILDTAQAMGTLDKNAVKVDKTTGKLSVNGDSFRDSIRVKPGDKTYFTSEVLTTALGTFTGDMTKAQLLAKGFSEESANALLRQAALAKKAATEAKNISQVLDIAKETLGSGYAKTFQLLFGDFKEAKKTFTGLSNALTGIITKSANARNKVLEDFRKLGGREVAIEGIKNAFKALSAILKPVKDAFREIFPAKTGKDLFEIAKRFNQLAKDLKIGDDKAKDLKKTFAGVFAVFHIGVTAIKAVVGFIGKLLGVINDGSGGVLAFTGSVGDFLVSLDKAISRGGDFGKVFRQVPELIKAPIGELKKLADLIKGLFDGQDSDASDKFSELFDKLGVDIAPLQKALAFVKHTFTRIFEVADSTYKSVSPVLQGLGAVFVDLLRVVGNALKNLNIEDVLDSLQVLLTGGIFVAIKRGFTQVGEALGPRSALGQVHETVSVLTGSLKAMQQNLQARTLLTIAAAVVVLAGGLLLLSSIPADKLSAALSAVAVGLGELAAALAILSRLTGGGGAGLTGTTKVGKAFSAFGNTLTGAFNTARLPIIAAALVLVAGGMILLGIAVKQFSKLDTEDLAKGLVGMGGALYALLLATSLVPGARMVILAAAIIPLAIGIGLLATAVKIFGSLDLKSLGIGLLGMATALDILSLSMGKMGAITKQVGPSLLLAGPALIGIALALNTVIPAVVLLGGLRIDALGKGLLAMAGSLGILGAGMSVLGFEAQAIGPSILLVGPALIAIAFALDVLVPALITMGSVNIKTLAKGLISLAFALDIMGFAMVTIGRIAAKVGPQVLLVGPSLLAMAAALAILVPVIGILGTMKITTLLQGLVGMAAILGVLATIGAVASTPLTALGLAMLAFAGALTVGAAGIFLFAKALALLAGEGPKGIAIMTAAITSFILLLPKIAIDFAKGILSLITAMADVAPKIAIQMGLIIDALLDVIIHATPKIEAAIGVVLIALIATINRYTVPVVEAGFKIILALLQGIAAHIGEITRKGGEIISRFLAALATQAGGIVAAGAKVIVSFLQGIASKIGGIIAAGTNIAVKFLEGIARNAPRFVAAGTKAITSFLGAVASNLPRLIRSGVRVITSFLDGIGDALPQIAKSATRLITKFLDTIGNRENIANIVDHGIKAVTHFLQGIADGIRKDENLSKVIEAAFDIGEALVTGIVKGLASLPKKLAETMVGPVKGAVNKVKDLLHINSPSKVFIGIGESIGEGMEIGLRSLRPTLETGIIEPLSNLLERTNSGKEVGKFLAHDFLKGIEGTTADIKGAFQGLRAKFAEEEDKLTEQISAFQTKLREVRNSRSGPDGTRAKVNTAEEELADLRAKQRAARGLKEKASIQQDIDNKKKELEGLRLDDETAKNRISGIQAAIDQLKLVQADAKSATKSMFAGLEADKNKLLFLSTAYDTVTERLQAVQSKIKELSEQYAALPDVGALLSDAQNSVEAAIRAEIDKQDQLEAYNKMSVDERIAYNKAARKKAAEEERIEAAKKALDEAALYKKALQEQIVATEKYNDTLNKLRALGLDDATYNKLLKDGIKDQDFADDLLKSGAAGLAELKALNERLAKDSEKLATDAAAELFNAGIQAAEGLVQGLKNQQAAIQAQMDTIANGMVAAIKKALGIKSPSRVMAEVGKFTAQGLVSGIETTSSAVANAAAGIGDAAVQGVQDSLSRVATALNAEIDTDLTITPILDLSNVERGAKQIGELANAKAVVDVIPNTGAASYGQATAIADEHAAAQATAVDTQQLVDARSFEFKQYNSSPETLSDTEIYRQTNNQLSQVKKLLGV